MKKFLSRSLSLFSLIIQTVTSKTDAPTHTHTHKQTVSYRMVCIQLGPVTENLIGKAVQVLDDIGEPWNFR